METRQLQVLYDHNDDVSALCQKILDLEDAIEKLESELAEKENEIGTLQTDLDDCQKGGQGNESIS